MLGRFWMAAFLLGLGFAEQPTYGQEGALPATKPSSKEPSTSKARRDSLAAEVKKSTSESESADRDDAKVKIQLIALSGHYVDFNQPLSIDPASLLLGGPPTKQKSFYRLCEFVDELAKNSAIQWVVFDLSDPELSMNPAQQAEIGRRIAKLQSTGKRLIAWLENAKSDHLSIAASCDEVIMADFGGVDFPSATMQSIFYREAMDLLGIKASVVRAGDFKGAVEPYMNAQMSDHLRSHYLEMLASINDARVSRIAKGRGLTVAAVRDIQQKRFLLPHEAVSKGLVDRLAPYGAMKETVDGIVNKATDWIEPKKKTEKDLSFFEVMSMVMSGPKKASSRTKDASIAVLHLSGVITDSKQSSPGSIAAGPMVDSIKALIEDDKVQGVVVRINSPGGSATASESIRQALIKLADKKPTVVSMGEMAASGGYWISCIGAPVLAEQGTITGSIGVFSLKLSFGSLLRRIGIHMETLALDSSAAAFSPDRPWTEGDEAVLQETIDDVYQRFLRLVGKSRGLTIEQVSPLAGGRVWSGSQAKAHGLVDELGGLDDALGMIAKKAKLEKYKVVHQPDPSSGLDLFELLSPSDEDELSMRVFSKEILERLQGSGISMRTLQLLIDEAQPFSMHGPRVWALHPAEVKVR